MYYIVALGNPGEEYATTRHNVGWLSLDAVVVARSLPTPHQSSAVSGRLTRGMIENVEVQALYPDTFMNHSGRAVKKFVPHEKLSTLIVLYDDVALPLGEVRVSYARGDGGHNGIKSIIASMGSNEFIRVRIGIAPKQFLTGKTKVITGEKMHDFVLGSFSKSEQTLLQKDIFPLVDTILGVLVKEGKEVAMNRFN